MRAVVHDGPRGVAVTEPGSPTPTSGILVSREPPPENAAEGHDHFDSARPAGPRSRRAPVRRAEEDA